MKKERTLIEHFKDIFILYIALTTIATLAQYVAKVIANSCFK